MELLGFNTWMKKSLNEKKISQEIDYSKWAKPNQYNYKEDDEVCVEVSHSEPGITEKSNHQVSVTDKKLEEDISGGLKKKQMIELEKLLKKHDYYFVYANGRAYEKGRDEEQEIEKLVKDIDTSDGKKDALKLYRKYLKKHESVDKSKGRSLEQLVAQRYGQSTVLPETIGVIPTGSLSEIKPVNAKGKSYMSDGGNMNYNLEQWIPPTPKLKSMKEKHFDRTSKFGRIYK